MSQKRMRTNDTDLARIAAIAMLAACGGGQSGGTPSVVAPVETALPPLPTSSDGDKPRPRHDVNVAAPNDDDRHCCAGKNACKGKGMCKTDSHACKGQNECKGTGGCKSPDC